MSALRVLLVSWEYPPAMYGGLGRHVHALSEALTRSGHEVTVLSQGPEGTPTFEPATAGSPRVVRALTAPGGPDPGRDTEAFVRLLQDGLVQAYETHASGWRPDVVHGHDWVVAEALAAVGERTGAPAVATVHATETGLYQGHVDSRFSRWRHRVERDLVRSAERTVVCSAAMRDEVTAGLGADPGRVRIVPNGVHPSRWATTAAQRSQARASLGVADGPLVVFVGRLEHEKGAQDAIDALARLGDGTHAGPHLVLAGDGARRDDLRAQAEARAVGDRVHLPGRLPDATIAGLLATGDVAVVPSRYEPFGMVALEAMAAGTPVVVTDTGGLAEIVDDGVTGLVVPPADPVALAGAVEALLDDRARAARLATAAGQVVRTQYGWDRVAERTAAVYEEVRA